MGILTLTNNINIVWKGSFDTAPGNPQVGWAYYDTVKKCLLFMMEVLGKL